MSHPTDHKVGWRSERQIAQFAEALRRELGVDHSLEFDPLLAIRHFEKVGVRGKGLLRVAPPFRAPDGCPPARVKFNPLRLFVDKSVLEEAKNGVPEARFILNHEIGHMVQHDHMAKAFSNEEAARIRYVQPEYRAEWQADKFADHVSLPWKFVPAFQFERLTLAARCNVPLAVAVRQTDALRASRRYLGEACPSCGNFTVVRNLAGGKCDTCSREISCA